MPATGLATYPVTVQEQLAGVVELVGALLGQNLQGLYLTGDAFTGSSSAEASTLRLLVVTARDVPRDTRLGLVQTYLRHSLQPAALEVLVIRAADLAAAPPSVLVQLHYTEAQRQQLELETTGHTWLRWPEGPTGAVDRATLLQRLEHGSVALSGGPLTQLLPAAESTKQDMERPHPSGTDAPTSGQQLTFDH